ncbi:MAG: two-component sensor histidine kinase [Ruminococcus sp.]|nr:two-component sensor histidine kinase [Ruminococcus sp.]
MKQVDNKSSKSTPTGWARVPLKVRLMACFLLFALALLVFLWLFQTVFLDDFYRFIKTTDIQRDTTRVVDNINSEELEEIISDIYTDDDMAVGVFDVSDGIPIPVYITEAQQEYGLELHIEEILGYYEEVAERGERVLFDTEIVRRPPFRDNAPPGGEEINARAMACAEIVQADNGHEYMVVLKVPITPVLSTVETLQVQLMIVTVVLVVFSVCISLVFSQRLSKPLSRTNESAKELARGNYQVSFEGDGCKEIWELSHTLNVATAELATVDSLRRELIANISHDLRTPLTMITGYAEVMRDIPGENSPENLQVIIDESQRLSHLVTDLMDLSKLESSSAELHKDRFCITDSVRDIFRRYKKMTLQDEYSFEFNSDENVFVWGDELRISQVIYNLVNNAINYSTDDKTIIVSQKLSDGRVRIEVTDHGQGISKENLKYIWDRYYRVDKEHQRAKVGSGLGLSIVKNILILHGARFGVVSQPGVGSTFWFELDALPAETPSEEDRPASE